MSQPGPSNLGGACDAEGGRVEGEESQKTSRSARAMRSEFLVSRKHRAVMASKDAHDTASLVRCYNEAADEVEKEVLREWSFRYISCFTNPKQVLRRCHWEAFLELGNVDSQSVSEAEKQFWLYWIEAIFGKVNSSFPETVEAVELALRMIPHEVFVGNLSPLTKAMNRLLKMLDPQEVPLVKQNFQALRPILLGVHQIFVVLQNAASDFLDMNQLLYQDVIKRLREIKTEQRYYPIYYLASVVEQRLSRIAKGERAKPLIGAFRKGAHGVRAVLAASNVVSKALKLEFDLEALDKAIGEAAKAIEPDDMQRGEWYRRIYRFGLVAARCQVDGDAFDAFSREAEELLKTTP